MTRTPIPWSRLIAEGAAIVVSILLAFWVDAAWSRHQESEEEALLSARLSEELAGNLSWVDNSARALESLQANAEAMAALLQSADQSDAVSLPDSLIASLFYNPEWSSLETATADGLQASGRISLFQDAAVVEKLALWESRRGAVVLRQQELREHFNDRLLPYLSDQTDIAPFVANRDRYNQRDLDGRAFPWLGIDGLTQVREVGLLRNLVLERVLFLGATRIQVDMAVDALTDLQDAVVRPE